MSDLPTSEVTANSLTGETMSEHIHVSGMLRFEYDFEDVAHRTLKVMARTVNGRLTGAETLCHDDVVPTKLHRRA